MSSDKNLDKGLKIPLSDWIVLSVTLFIIPIIWGLIYLILHLMFVDDVIYTLIVLGSLSVIFIIILELYVKTSKRLSSYATLTGYYSYKPVFIDVLTLSGRSFFSTLIISIILASWIVDSGYFNAKLSFKLLILSLVLSILIQGLYIILSYNSKRKLLRTAKYKIKPEIKEYLRTNNPNSNRISDYWFADIEPESLMLSAGITTFGLQNVVIISHLLSYKLADDELIAVLSHEEGHIAKNHLLKSYVMGGFEGILRTLRFYISFLTFTTSIGGINGIFYTSILGRVLLFLLLLLIFLSSGIFSAYTRHSMLLNEIEADAYSAELVGYNLMANTFKKIPSMMLYSTDTRATSIFDFRLMIMREKAKDTSQ